MKVELNLEYVFSALVEIGVTEPAKAAAFLVHADADLRAIVRELDRAPNGTGEWELELKRELEETIRKVYG
jgi:hypothetical protein